MTQTSKSIPATPKQAAACCLPIDDRLDPELFKALGDSTRVCLLACIAKCGRPCTVGEIAECCSVDVSVVSRHLAILARAEVLESTRSGRLVRYRVRYAELARSLRSLADAVDECCPRGGECASEACCGPSAPSSTPGPN